jgi:hypothetical protein
MKQGDVKVVWIHTSTRESDVLGPSPGGRNSISSLGYCTSHTFCSLTMITYYVPEMILPRISEPQSTCYSLAVAVACKRLTGFLILIRMPSVVAAFVSP